MKTGLVSKYGARAGRGPLLLLALQELRAPLLGLCLPLLTAPAWAATSEAPSAVSLVYWSAGDCGPCRAWSQTERKQEFLSEAKALGVTLVEVQRPRLADPLSRYTWPKEQEALMQSYLAHQYAPAQLTPAFDFVCRGELLLRIDGLHEWDSFWKSSLRRSVKQCKAQPPG